MNERDMRHPFLTGDKVYLRGLARDDVDGPWLTWFNDREVTRYMYNGGYPTTREGHLAFYESTCVNNPDHLVLAIIEKATGRHVGNLGLHRISWIYRRAELGIVIGERSAHGKGLGTEACRLIVGHGFSRFNLHKVFARVEAENKAGVRMFEKAGFRIEATLKEEIIRDGGFYDSVYMSVFARDYSPPRG